MTQRIQERNKERFAVREQPPRPLRGHPSLKRRGITAATIVFIAVLVLSCTPAPQPKPATPQRIISLVPNVTEMLFSFALADKVIGVSDFDHFSPEVEKKPKVGGLINPDVEKIISMHPDLVITYGTQEVLRQHLESVGIPMFPYVHGNIEQTLRVMLDLGNAVGAAPKAQQVVADIRRTFDEVRAHAPPTPPKVLLVHSREAGTLGSFYSVGHRAFQNDLIEIAGGRNIFGEVDQETIQPALEEVISRKPDIIVETMSSPPDPTDAAQRRKDWAKLGFAANQVYIEGESYFLVPGPRLALASRRMSEIVRGVK